MGEIRNDNLNSAVNKKLLYILEGVNMKRRFKEKKYTIEIINIQSNGYLKSIFYYI